MPAKHIFYYDAIGEIIEYKIVWNHLCHPVKLQFICLNGLWHAGNKKLPLNAELCTLLKMDYSYPQTAMNYEP